jgi:hypothetical protein
MSRSSTDVIEEMEWYVKHAKIEARAALYELAKLSLARVEVLLGEAYAKLRYEAECKRAVETGRYDQA